MLSLSLSLQLTRAQLCRVAGIRARTASRKFTQSPGRILATNWQNFHNHLAEYSHPFDGILSLSLQPSSKNRAYAYLDLQFYSSQLGRRKLSLPAPSSKKKWKSSYQPINCSGGRLANFEAWKLKRGEKNNNRGFSPWRKFQLDVCVELRERWFQNRLYKFLITVMGHITCTRMEKFWSKACVRKTHGYRFAQNWPSSSSSTKTLNWQKSL